MKITIFFILFRSEKKIIKGKTDETHFFPIKQVRKHISNNTSNNQ